MGLYSKELKIYNLNVLKVLKWVERDILCHNMMFSNEKTHLVSMFYNNIPAL